MRRGTDTAIREETLNKSDFQLAGWAAVINAALAIPLFVFQLLTDAAGYDFPSKAIQIATVALFIFIFFRLKRLFFEIRFYRVDGYLSAIIAINAILGVATVFVPEDYAFLTLLLLAGNVVLGVLYIVVGIKLLAFPAAMPGLKLFCYSIIATGACAASIVFIPLSLITSMAMYIALASVFFSDVGESRPPYATAGGNDRVEPLF